jgi:hypothetical protein
MDSWGAEIKAPDLPKWDFLSSDEFTITVHLGGADDLRRTWVDRPNRRIEAMLPEVVVDLERHAGSRGAVRAAAEEQAQRSEEERQRREEEVRRQQLEQQRQDALEHDAAQWERAARIRAYAATVKARAEAEGRAGEVEEWCRWASDVADSLDPVLVHPLLGGSG